MATEETPEQRRAGIEIDGGFLRLRGLSHKLDAMPVGGTQCVGMIHVDSMTNSALLTPEHAVALRDWLNQAIDGTLED